MFTFEVTELLQFIRAKDIFICDVCVYAFANAECVCVYFNPFSPVLYIVVSVLWI